MESAHGASPLDAIDSQWGGSRRGSMADAEQGFDSGAGIIVVDDTPSALQLMVDLLGRDGYLVRPAQSGELAIRSALRRPPELILLDVQMPEMDGYEVCRRLKGDPRTAHIPVIFLSALNDTESRVRGLEVGGQDFISKPFQAEEALARVRTHLALGRSMLALDRMCAHLEQAAIRRTDDLDDLSRTLARQVLAHGETVRRLLLADRAIDAARDSILITDAAGSILAANPACVALTGVPGSDLLGEPLLSLFDDSDANGLDATLPLPGSLAGSWAGEMRLRQRSGAAVPVWMGLAEFRDSSDSLTHYVAVFSDISERKEAEARVQYLAEHDLLTGLPNRVLLRDRFEVALSVARRNHGHVALLFLDLDRFKSVNDFHGHTVGDGYLKQVSTAVCETLRSSDSLCRVGGDEFIALLTGTGRESDISDLATRVLRRVDREFDVDGHPVRRTASIGVALYPEDGDEFDDLSRKADTAMYNAKLAGRNAVVFHTEKMNEAFRRRADLDEALRSALANEEFFMRYQPQVELATGRTVGLEALVRWQRPGVGEVSPNDFIPFAEESGLIVNLGNAIVMLVCAQARAWLDEGLEIPISVNVSPVQVRSGRFDQVLIAALEQTQLPPRLIQIEITESGMIDETSVTEEMIERLQREGVMLSIDDFLTGYANFAYLRRFHPSQLKIDQSFVGTMTPGSESQAIVTAALQMAQILGIPTVAEGVETQAQRDLLEEARCTIGQGYLFSPPLVAAGIPAWLGDHRPTPSPTITKHRRARRRPTSKEHHERS